MEAGRLFSHKKFTHNLFPSSDTFSHLAVLYNKRDIYTICSSKIYCYNHDTSIWQTASYFVSWIVVQS